MILQFDNEYLEQEPKVTSWDHTHQQGAESNQLRLHYEVEKDQENKFLDQRVQ